MLRAASSRGPRSRTSEITMENSPAITTAHSGCRFTSSSTSSATRKSPQSIDGVFEHDPQTPEYECQPTKNRLTTP